jgi:cobalamin biosynthesis protein CobC
VGRRLLGVLGCPGPVRYVLPAYRSHRLPGARPIPIDGLEEEARAGGTILLANPNNPDGRLLAPERLLAAARMLGERGGLLVVDEAFADAVPGASVLPALRDEPVLVLRSFGKFFGLAGVRLGYACGAGAERLRGVLGSWPVSATALAWGAAAYADAPWIAAEPARLLAQAAALDGVLREAGLEPVGACPLFRLVRADGAALFGRLAEAGILTRPFAEAPRWLRLGLTAELDRLRAALRG